MKPSVLRIAYTGIVLVLAGASWPLPAAEKTTVPLLTDGFERMIAGDELVARGNDDWVCREKSKVTVISDPRQAAEGKQYLRAVATGEPLPEQAKTYLKIVEKGSEGGLHRSLAALGVDPAQLQGSELHFSIQARGNGYLQFYLYRYAANGGGVGNGANPYSPVTKVAADWGVIDWAYRVPVEPDVAEYRIAIHFFTDDNRGIDLDDCRVGLAKE